MTTTNLPYDPIVFGKNLKELRCQRGLTQNDLSRLLNISRSSIAHYERGTREPNLATLNRLCNFFDITTDEILGRDVHDTDVKYDNDRVNNTLKVADSDQ